MPELDWYTAEVAEVVQETPHDRTFHLTLLSPDRARFGFRPGQYLTLRIPTEDPPAERMYSLSGAPGHPLRITVRGVGSWGQAVYGLKQGTNIELRPPAGSFVLDLPEKEHLVMVAGGSGVTPFRAFVRHLLDLDHLGRVTLLHSCALEEQLLFREEFERWAGKVDSFSYVPTATNEPEGTTWTGARGRLERDTLAAYLPEPATTQVYACGPASLVTSALTWATELGVPEVNLRKESW